MNFYDKAADVFFKVIYVMFLGSCLYWVIYLMADMLAGGCY